MSLSALSLSDAAPNRKGASRRKVSVSPTYTPLVRVTFRANSADYTGTPIMISKTAIQFVEPFKHPTGGCILNFRRSLEMFGKERKRILVQEAFDDLAAACGAA